MSQKGLGRVETHWIEVPEYDWGEETPSFFRASLCPHRGHERLDTHDVHHAGEIVGQNVKSHL